MVMPRARQERRPSLRRKFFATTAPSSARASASSASSAAPPASRPRARTEDEGADDSLATPTTPGATPSAPTTTPATTPGSRAGRLLATFGARGRPRARRATVVGIEGSSGAAVGARAAELGLATTDAEESGTSEDRAGRERRIPATSRQTRASTVTGAATLLSSSSSSSSYSSSSPSGVGAGRARRTSTCSSLGVRPSSPRKSFDAAAAREHDSHKSVRLGTSIAAEIEEFLAETETHKFSPLVSSSSAPTTMSDSEGLSPQERHRVDFDDARVCQQRRGSMMAAKFKLGEQVLVLKRADQTMVIREGMVVHVHVESPVHGRQYAVRLEDPSGRVKVDEANLVESPSDSADALHRAQTYLFDVRHAAEGAEHIRDRVEKASRDPEALASLPSLERKMAQTLETLKYWTSSEPQIHDIGALSFNAVEAREMIIGEARRRIEAAEFELYLSRGRLCFNTDRNEEALADALAALDRSPNAKEAALLHSMALFNLSETASGFEQRDLKEGRRPIVHGRGGVSSAHGLGEGASPDTTSMSSLAAGRPKSQSVHLDRGARMLEAGNDHLDVSDEVEDHTARGSTPRRTSRASSEHWAASPPTFWTRSASRLRSKAQGSGVGSRRRRRSFIALSTTSSSMGETGSARSMETGSTRSVMSPREEEEEVEQDAGHHEDEELLCMDEHGAPAPRPSGEPKEGAFAPFARAWQRCQGGGQQELGESIVEEIDQYLCALDAEAVLERFQAAGRLASKNGATAAGGDTGASDGEDDDGDYIL